MNYRARDGFCRRWLRGRPAGHRLAKQNSSQCCQDRSQHDHSARRLLSASPRNRTSSCSFEHCRARPAHSQGDLLSQVSRPGFEPGPGPSEGPMQSATPSGFKSHQEPTTGFAPASTCLQDRRLSQSSHVGNKHEREESNPVRQFWRLTALPGAHSCKARGNKPRGRLNSVTSPAGRSSTSR